VHCIDMVIAALRMERQKLDAVIDTLERERTSNSPAILSHPVCT
jgi:hypothetical protein